MPATDVHDVITPTTALCGHPTCDPYVRRNSVVDEPVVVVLYLACDGNRHLFRDNNPDGLLLKSTTTGWTVTRERRTEVEGGWTMVVEDEPVCTATHEGDSWVARHPSGWTLARTDGQYGLMGRVARHYLRTATNEEN